MKLSYVFVSLRWRGGGRVDAQKQRHLKKKSRRGKRNDTLLPPCVFFSFFPECFDLPAKQVVDTNFWLVFELNSRRNEASNSSWSNILYTNQLLKGRETEKNRHRLNRLMLIEYESIENDISSSRWKREPSIKVSVEENASSLFNISLWQEQQGIA